MYHIPRLLHSTLIPHKAPLHLGELWEMNMLYEGNKGIKYGCCLYFNVYAAPLVPKHYLASLQVVKAKLQQSKNKQTKNPTKLLHQ